MAPAQGILMPIRDLQDQIIENCQFLCEPAAKIITTLDGNNTWKLFVFKRQAGPREELLSASGSSLYAAFEQLHRKSAQATHNFMAVNGVGFTRDLTFRPEERVGGVLGRTSADSDSSWERSHVFNIRGEDINSQSEASSDEDHYSPEASRGRKAIAGSSGRRRNRQRARSRSVASSASGSDGSAGCRRRLSPVRHSTIPRVPHLLPPSVVCPGPRPPPPGWAGPPPPPPARGTLPPRMRYQSHPPPPPPSTQSVEQPPRGPSRPVTSLKAPVNDMAPSTTPVRLAVNWIGRGQTMILEHCQPTMRALEEAALNHVRRNASSFPNVSPADCMSPRIFGLSATVKGVYLGGDLYEFSDYGESEDLTKIFKAEALPKFEIEVMSTVGLPSLAPATT